MHDETKGNWSFEIYINHGTNYIVNYYYLLQTSNSTNCIKEKDS